MDRERHFRSVDETARYLDSTAREYASKLKHLSCADQDDLCQEVLVAYFTHKPNLSTTRDAHTWCHGALTARLVSDSRKRGPEHLPLPEAIPAEVSGAYSRSLELQPETALEHRQLGVIVDKARKAAYPIHQIIMNATLDEGLAHPAAAVELNIPVGTVKSGVRRGKRKAREYLTNHHPDIL